MQASMGPPALELWTQDATIALLLIISPHVHRDEGRCRVAYRCWGCSSQSDMKTHTRGGAVVITPAKM